MRRSPGKGRRIARRAERRERLAPAIEALRAAATLYEHACIIGYVREHAAASVVCACGFEQDSRTAGEYAGDDVELAPCARGVSLAVPCPSETCITHERHEEETRAAD